MKLFRAATGTLLALACLMTRSAAQDAPAVSPPATVDPQTDSPQTAIPAAPPGPAAIPPAALPAVPLERVPYQVQVHLALDLGPADAPAIQRRLTDEIQGILAGQIGAFWKLRFHSGVDSWLGAPADVSRLPADVLARRADPEDDKVFLLGVQRTGSEVVVTAREWDAATRTLGPTQTRQTRDTRAAAVIAVAALHAAFRPLVQIEQNKQGVVTLRGRAALVPPHDITWSPFSSGAVFEPYYRYLNKERLVERIQRIPWTYLVAGELLPEDGQARAEPLSGLRTAISARRRRIEAIALGVRIQNIGTTVQLKTRPPASREIVSADVLIRAQRFVPPVPEGESPPEPLARLVSDRRGRVVIPLGLVEPGRPLWLFIHSGSQLLGRVPFIPGIRELEELELADDSLRLQVEGDISLFQARLVDLAAQRAVLMALTRKRANDKDFTASDELLKKLSESAKPATLLAELNTIRLPALKTAREQRDRATEARIKKLGDDTAEIINVHFANEKIGELREEIQELKLVAEDEAAGRPTRERVTKPKPTRGKTRKGAKKKAAAPAADAPPAAAR